MARLSLIPLLMSMMLAFAVAPAAAFDWRGQLTQAEENLTGDALTNENCAPALKAWTDRLATLPSASFAPRSRREAEQIAAHGAFWLERFFKLRLLLKQRLDSFASPSRACVDAMRLAFAYSRFAEDYLAQWLIERGRLDGAPRAILAGGPPHVLINPRAGGAELRAGDILLMRGPKFLSSMIARAGDEENDFSHLAMVGVDGAGHKYIVESLVQSGVGVTPLDDYLKQTNEWRVIVLRARDLTLAARAGAAAYARAQRAIDAGQPIPYNYSLDVSDNSRLFCAQVARVAFETASGGRWAPPQFRSSLKQFRRTVLGRALGVSVADTFAPSDLQFDRRFAIVAEFRNPALISAARHGNVAMSRLLAWLRQGYDFGPDFTAEITAKVLYAILAPKGLGEMTVEGAVTLAKAQDAYDLLVKRADAIDARAIGETGRPLTFHELARGLDEMRVNDCRMSRTDPASAAQLAQLLVPPPTACAMPSLATGAMSPRRPPGGQISLRTGN
ncbi:YiiX/YebB-like N1pC/P60 family cysteine hydrolase [Rhodoblastus sp.]|uniref:YiiX/YebB-like N1pC/P60 family cysteine hydrolase n=1 Tax=Rhodoblastus sp. TaxID=1962975 RepID=UPI003F957D9A